MKKSYFKPLVLMIRPLPATPTMNAGSGVDLEVDKKPYDGEFDSKKASWE